MQERLSWSLTWGWGCPSSLELRGPVSWTGRGRLVTHKRVTVILLTLALELLLKDGNGSRRLIKNAPDFPRCPCLVTVPKVP